MTVIEVLGSADVGLDLGVFPVIPVQLAISSTPSATVSQTFPFGNHIQNTKAPSFVLTDEVILPWKCIHNSLSQNSHKSKKNNVMRGDFDLKISKNAHISYVALCCLMQLPDSSLCLVLVTLIKLRIILEIFLSPLLGFVFLKILFNMNLQPHFDAPSYPI